MAHMRAACSILYAAIKQTFLADSVQVKEFTAAVRRLVENAGIKNISRATESCVTAQLAKVRIRKALCVRHSTLSHFSESLAMFKSITF